MTKVHYGIRHHGPGSAKSLHNALSKQQPDIVLIEAPADTESVIEQIKNESFAKIKPPVAILTYDPKELERASYLPFASFSPEWIAIKYGLENDVPIKCIDLPMMHSLVLKNDQEHDQKAPEEFTAEELQALEMRSDPLLQISKLAGYSDSERWWESIVENRDDAEGVFIMIDEIMTTLREELDLPESQETLVREAFMRKQIRLAEKQYENLAIITGAWHLPAIKKNTKISDDNALLRGLPKTKTISTWIPWSYEKLATQSGYGAGVSSPAWYELIYKSRKDAALQFITKAARRFRKEDLEASSAHVIEATRLAESLASLRSLPLPGLDEIYESIVSTFCNGYTEPMKVIEEKLIIGNKFGKLPEDSDSIPLQKDIEKHQKKLRLKPSEESTELSLDLRKELHLKKSQFLHRMLIAGIPWGEKWKASGKKGTFHENWTLKWDPSFAIKIIDAGTWGTTLEEACLHYLGHTLKTEDELDALIPLIDEVLYADLKDFVPKLMQKIEQTAALSRNIESMMRSLKPLVKAYLYGNVRNTDLSSMREVIYSLLPRVFAGIIPACSGMNEEAAKDMVDLLAETGNQISLLSEDDFTKEWNMQLSKLASNNSVPPIIRGYSIRCLLDREVIEISDCAKELSQELSVGTPTSESAEWLSGFVKGNVMLLVYNEELWRVISDWVEEIEEDPFLDVLPVLRRTFSQFSIAERSQLANLVAKGPQRQTTREVEIDLSRFEQVKPTVLKLLGY